MPNPVPGTVIPTGSLVSPGGAQGIPGVQGASAVVGLLTLSSAYNFTSADSGKYAICSGGSWTLGLPAPVPGMNYRVRNDMGIAGTTGIITIQPASGTIDGAATLALLAGQEVLIMTDGANWRTFGRQRNVVLGTQDITAATASGVVLLPPGYRYYELNFEGLQPVTNNTGLTMNISSDGGNTWLTGSTYLNDVIYNNATTTVANSWATQAYSVLTPGIGVGNVGGCSYVKLWPGTTGLGPHLKFEGWCYNQTLAFVVGYLGMTTYNAAIIANAVRYQMASGNIAASQLTVKGVV